MTRMTRGIIIVATLFLTGYAICTRIAPLAISIELTITCLIFLLALSLARGKNIIRYTFLLCLIAQLRYLIWRFNCTVGFEYPPNNIAAAFLLIADCYCTLMVLGATFSYWLREPDDQVFDFEIPPKPEPHHLVDIYITTCREPVDLLRRTISGALSIRYSNKAIYILDDGHREELRALADEMGVGYITRQGNEHFKAGNLNNAISQTNGEFILSLDADHVCASTIVDYALPTFLADEKVAIVQCAQRAINPSVIDRTLRYRGFATDLATTFYVYLPSIAFWQGGLWTGSGAILRRSALDEIGGVCTGSVTEDIHTSFVLFDRGWKIAYVPIPQLLALSPENLDAFLTQQKRWCIGALQLNLGVKYWKFSNLTLPQRAIQLFNLLGFGSFMPRLIWILCPILFVMFQITPARMLPEEFLIAWTPLFVLSLRGNLLVARKNFSIIISDVLDTLKSSAMLAALISVFMQGLAQPFIVTPKGFKDPALTEWRVCIPYVLLLVPALAVSTILTVRYLFHPDLSFPFILFGWYSVFLLANTVCIALEDNQPLAMHTVPADLPVTLRFGESQIQARLLRVSESGGTIALVSPVVLKPDEQFEVTIEDPICNWQERVRFIGQKKLHDDAYIIDVSFMSGKRNMTEFNNFIRLTICDNKVWQVVPNCHVQTAFSNMLMTPFQHLVKTLRRLSRYQDFSLSDKPNCFPSSSIIAE